MAQSLHKREAAERPESCGLKHACNKRMIVRLLCGGVCEMLHYTVVVVVFSDEKISYAVFLKHFDITVNYGLAAYRK